MATSLRSPSQLVDLNRCIRVEAQPAAAPASSASDATSAAPKGFHSMDDVRASLESLQRKQRDKARKRQASSAAKQQQQQQNQGAASSKPSNTQQSNETGRKFSAARARASAAAASAASSAAALPSPVPAAAPSGLLSPTSFSRLVADPSSLSLSAIQSLHAALQQQILHEMKVELQAPEQKFDDVVKEGFEEIEREHQKQQQQQQHSSQLKQSQQQPPIHQHESLQVPLQPERAAWSPPKPSHPAPLRMHRRNSSGGGSGIPSPAGLISPGTRSPHSASSSASPLPSFRPHHLSVNVRAGTGDGFVSPPLSTHPLSGHSITPGPSRPASTRGTATPSTPAQAASRAQMRFLMQQRARTPSSASHAQQLASHPAVQQLSELLSPRRSPSSEVAASAGAPVAPADPPPRISSPLYAVGGGLHRFDRFLSSASATPSAVVSPAATPSRHESQRSVCHPEDDSAAGAHHLNRSASRSGDVASPFSGHSPVPPLHRSRRSSYAPSDAAPPTWSLVSPMPMPPQQPPSLDHSPLPPSAQQGSRQLSAGKRRNYRAYSPAITPSSADATSRSPSFNETPQPTPPMHRSIAFPFHALHDSATTIAAGGNSRSPYPAFLTPEPANQLNRSAPITPASAPSFSQASFDFNLSGSGRKAPQQQRTSFPAIPDATARPEEPLLLFSPPSYSRPSSSLLPRSPAQPRPPSMPARPQSESAGKRAHVAQARALAEQQRGARSQTAATGTSHIRMQRMRPIGAANNNAVSSSPLSLKLSNWTQQQPQPTHSDGVYSTGSSATHRPYRKKPASIDILSSAATHRAATTNRSPAAAQSQPQPMQPQPLLSPTAAAASAAAQHVAGRVAAQRKFFAPESPNQSASSSPASRSSAPLLPLHLPPALSAATTSSVSMQAIAEGDEVAAALHSARIAQGLGSGSSGGGSAPSFTPNGSVRPAQLGSVIFRSHPQRPPPHSSSLRSSGGSSLSDSPRSLRNSFDAPFVVEHADDYAEEENEDAFREELAAMHAASDASVSRLHRGLEHDAIPFPSESDMAAEEAYLSD